MKELGKVDKMFFEKLLEAPFSTPSESFYLEFGILPVWSIIKGRRINFLKYLVDRNPESMLGRVFKIQWIDPDPGDWSYPVSKDLEDLDIDLTLDQIRDMSKTKFNKTQCLQLHTVSDSKIYPLIKSVNTRGTC